MGFFRWPVAVTPPMPAVVVPMMVREGERVGKGLVPVAVTAMKMKTPMAAPDAGPVAKIHTAVDAKVALGDILVEIEKEAPEDG